MTPLCQATSPGFTSGTTSGTSSSMRNALELSIITAPASTTAWRICFDRPAPQENSAMSTPANDSGVISCTTSSPAGTWPQPAKGSLLPAERADASARTSLAGKSTSCSTCRNSAPTAPVAPAIATTGFAGIFFVQVIAVLPFPRLFPGWRSQSARGVGAPNSWDRGGEAYFGTRAAGIARRRRAPVLRSVEPFRRSAERRNVNVPCSSSPRSPRRRVASPRTRCRYPGRTPYAGSVRPPRPAHRPPPPTGGWARWRWPGC